MKNIDVIYLISIKSSSLPVDNWMYSIINLWPYRFPVMTTAKVKYTDPLLLTLCETVTCSNLALKSSRINLLKFSTVKFSGLKCRQICVLHNSIVCHLCLHYSIDVSVWKPSPRPLRRWYYSPLMTHQNVLLWHPVWLYFCPFCIYFTLITRNPILWNFGLSSTVF